MAYIEFKNVTKEFEEENNNVKVLKKLNFEIEKGELVVITGPSCTGKTTLLNILGGIDKIDGGNVIVNETDITLLKERKLVKYRRENVGIAFESCGLVQSLSVKENIELATQLRKEKINADAIIKKVGLTKKANNFPSGLSASEKQRVAIGIAIAKNPAILLCDEPVKSLDDKGCKQIIKLLQTLSKKEKTTVVIATKNSTIASIANRVISLKNGRIQEVKINEKPKNAGDLSW